jgi:hypothetical protein
MNTSDVIALIALLVSLGGFVLSAKNFRSNLRLSYLAMKVDILSKLERADILASDIDSHMRATFKEASKGSGASDEMFALSGKWKQVQEQISELKDKVAHMKPEADAAQIEHELQIASQLIPRLEDLQTEAQTMETKAKKRTNHGIITN